MYHLGQDGLVKLHDHRAGSEQVLDFLTEGGYDISSEALARFIGSIRDALQPHCPGEQIGAGKGHLDRAIGEFPDRCKLVHGEGAGRAAPQSSEDGRVPDRLGGDIKRLEFASEFLGMLNIGKKVDDGNELTVLQPAADEAGIAVAPLLAVGHHVHPGLDLRLDDLGDGPVSQRLECRLVETAFKSVMERAQEPLRRGQLPMPMTESGVTTGI